MCNLSETDMLCTHKHTSSVQNTAKNGTVTAVKILKHTQAFYRI